jgi:Lrp/AsnC family transcriptional regulator for asnA, asnC and gidA
MEKVDDLDRDILNIITKNARIPFKDVAEECGVSRAAIHQRVQRLFAIVEYQPPFNGCVQNGE